MVKTHLIKMRGKKQQVEIMYSKFADLYLLLFLMKYTRKHLTTGLSCEFPRQFHIYNKYYKSTTEAVNQCTVVR